MVNTGRLAVYADGAWFRQRSSTSSGSRAHLISRLEANQISTFVFGFAPASQVAQTRCGGIFQVQGRGATSPLIAVRHAGRLPGLTPKIDSVLSETCPDTTSTDGKSQNIQAQA